MAQPLVLQGTGRELKHTLEEFPNSRFRLELLPELSVATELNEDTLSSSGSLYDLLGDYIGCVDGSGESNAANAGELFTDYLAKKHNEGHL